MDQGEKAVLKISGCGGRMVGFDVVFERQPIRGACQSVKVDSHAHRARLLRIVVADAHALGMDGLDVLAGEGEVDFDLFTKVQGLVELDADAAQ